MSDYLLAFALLAVASLATTVTFGLLWNRSRLSVKYDTRLSFRMSTYAFFGLLPAHAVVDIAILHLVFG